MANGQTEVFLPIEFGFAGVVNPFLLLGFRFAALI